MIRKTSWNSTIVAKVAEYTLVGKKGENQQIVTDVSQMDQGDTCCIGSSKCIYS